MVQCFAPDCNHASESHTCRFFGFPSTTKKEEQYKRWIKLLRRADRPPGKYARVCSCHFRDGIKENGPEISKRNANTLFPPDDYSAAAKAKTKARKLKKSAESSKRESVEEMVLKFKENVPENAEKKGTPVQEVVLQAEVNRMKRKLDCYEQKEQYQRTHYSVTNLKEEVLRMETGLPTREIFNIVVNYALRFKDSISYFYGWAVINISFEDQIFITLMKCRQNYTNLHLAQLFCCSQVTISNIVITFAYVLHNILFKDIMTTIPSRLKNSTCSPSSFSGFGSCKVVIDCTDIEIATPGLMSQQCATYSSYRGMNSFKVLVGVAPNAVITFISPLFPGSISDKEIVKKSGFLKQLETGDLVLADKGFLIFLRYTIYGYTIHIL